MLAFCMVGQASFLCKSLATVVTLEGFNFLMHRPNMTSQGFGAHQFLAVRTVNGLSLYLMGLQLVLIGFDVTHSENTKYLMSAKLQTYFSTHDFIEKGFHRRHLGSAKSQYFWNRSVLRWCFRPLKSSSHLRFGSS